MPSTHPGPFITLLFLALLAGCGEPPMPRSSDSGPPEAGTGEPSPPSRGAYERSVVFTTTGSDSTLVVPWVMEASVRPGSVDRVHRGWLLRAGSWEPFFRAEWETAPTREPWRVLPRGPFRILVGEGDRLDRIIFDGGSRQLEVVLDQTLAEWTGNRGGSFNVLEGGLILAERRVAGTILDVSQGIRLEDGALGDWLLLHSGDSLTVVIQAPLYDADEPPYQGWGIRDGDELQWPRIRVDWLETRAYEPARRDIPFRLAITTPDGELEGTLEVGSIQLETRPGQDPVLPVDGLMEVAGTLRISGGPELPVRGILRHRQP